MRGALPSTPSTTQLDDPDRGIPAGWPPWAESLAFLYLPFLIGVALTFAETSDDVFITLRYAANLVHGHGLAFNPGQHVQGFTSPLGLAVATLAYLFPGGFALFKMKLLSVVFGVLALREGGVMLTHLTLSPWARRAASVTLGLSPIIAFAAGNGLETSLELFLLMAVVRRLVDDREEPATWSVATLAFAAVLARPDALAPLACVALAGLMIERRRPLIERSRWLVGAMLAALVTLVGEWLYFHSALPNTYYAKHLAFGASLRLGADYLNNLLVPAQNSLVAFPHRVMALLIVLEALFFVVGAYQAWRYRRRLVYLVALVVGQALFILLAGGDYMIGERFLAPLAIPFIILEALGVASLARSLRRRLRPDLSRVPSMLGATLLAATSVVPLWYVNAPAGSIKGLNDRMLLASSPQPAAFIWPRLPSLVSCVGRGGLVAATEIGYLGFARQDLAILDLRGLTNRAIATAAPASIKEQRGVFDPAWYRPDSPVGREIVRERPSLILQYNAVAVPTALDGRYRLVRTIEHEGNQLEVYVPTASSGGCSR
jgi:hypothetical protein